MTGDKLQVTSDKRDEDRKDHGYRKLRVWHLADQLARKGRRELKQFVSMALGSLAEVEYLLEFSRAEQMVSQEIHRQVERTRQEAGKLLWGFYESL